MDKSLKPDPDSPSATLFDRVAVGFLSGVVAFITGCLVWLVVAGLNMGGAPIAFLPAAWIWWFTAVMAALGFVRKENLIAKVLGKAWQFIAAMWGFERL